MVFLLYFFFDMFIVIVLIFFVYKLFIKGFVYKFYFNYVNLLN